MTQPPLFTQWLLEISLAASERDALVGDLCEEFTTIVLPRRGGRASRWWYRRQVARALPPLWMRAWERASVLRASGACAIAGVAATSPAATLMALRAFVLQQVPLKTTAELSQPFAIALLAVVGLSIAAAIAAAVGILNGNRQSSPVA